MSHHIVAIIGGAVSGAEAANQLTRRGIRCIVFEQNLLPYGKIEDGLPKWHAKLRDKEEANIDEKLRHPLVTYVPGVQLGCDLHFDEIADNWGLSAILLATGAWSDRPLGIPGIDDYIGKGLYYQNPFIYWYNHKHEPGYTGETCTVADNALIVGGGLASIDVAKVLMMETVEKALAEHGHHVNMFDLERGIDRVLSEKQLTLEDLGLKGCTIVYRRRTKDMPLSPGDTDTPEKLAKAEAVREKVLRNAQARYFFRVLPCHVPVDKIVEKGRLAGLLLRETRVEGGRVVEVPGTDKSFLSPLVISSIGSLPEPIPGIPMDGQVYQLEEGTSCRVAGRQNIFALGNAVTGRGNIKESLDHGRTIAQLVAESYLGHPSENTSALLREKERAVNGAIGEVHEKLSGLKAPSEEQVCAIYERVKILQRKAGYDGHYDTWVNSHRPQRLEQLLQLTGH